MFSITLSTHIIILYQRRLGLFSEEKVSQEIGRSICPVKGALADGMYDSDKNFRYLSKNHIKAGINDKKQFQG